MILQELLRSTVLYKGVVRPLVQTWTDSVVSRYSKQNLLLPYQTASLSSFDDSLPLKEAVVDETSMMLGMSLSLSEITGTRTISSQIAFSNSKQAISNNRDVMLVCGPINERIAELGKTHYRAYPEYVDLRSGSSSLVVGSTTGYYTEQIYFYLISETHERREYLGEFSLTHEENHLLYLKEGGDRHGID